MGSDLTPCVDIILSFTKQLNDHPFNVMNKIL
jgi:hypothetical protein